MSKKLIRDIGEFGLINKIKQETDKINISDKNIVVGIGDDCFVSRFNKDDLLVVTKDVMVENVHFKRNWITPRQLGYKSLAINLSDLASMGWCRPLYAILGIALTKDVTVGYAGQLLKGIKNIADKYNVKLVGGDTVSSKRDIVISVTLIGAIKKKYILRRSGAKPGDYVFVSGTFGDSAGGLHMLQNKKKNKYLIKKHLLPEPKIELSKKISQKGYASSMIDSSDGLAASLRFICQESKTGAEVNIESIPISDMLKNLIKNEKEVLNMVLNGGEDYELVFTVRPRHYDKVLKNIDGVKCVGKITGNKKINYTVDNCKMNFNYKGYEHFKR